MISTRKYNFIFIIQLLLIVGILGGGGYLIYKNTNTKDVKENIVEEDIIVPDIKEIDEEIIEVESNENIVYDGYDVSIRIPKITSELGTDINNKIKEDLSEYYNMKDHSIDFEYYINNDIVSLVIKVEDVLKQENYLTYNFNKDDYSLISNSKLLELKGIKEDSFHGIIVNIYENHLKDNLEEGKTEIDVTTENYKKTTDKDNCNISLPMYLNHDNHLNVVFSEYEDEGIIVKYIYNLNSKKVVER